MSIISASTTTTTALQYTADTTGTLVFKTGATPTTALTINADQTVTFAAGITLGALTTSGNLTFTGTGNRIIGDFSNVTVANQVMFQTSTANSGTTVTAIPSGTGTFSQFSANSNSDPTNASRISIRINSGSAVAVLGSEITGTGTYLPLVMYTGGSERLRIDTSGQVGIGTASPISPLTVASSSTIAVGTPSVILQGGNNTERFAAYSSGGVGPGTAAFLAASARGTIASPTAVQANDNLGYFQFGGYDGTAYSRSAWVSGFAAENYSATNRGSILAFSTTPLASTTIAERMRIDASGNVGIGTTSPLGVLDARGNVYLGSSSSANTTFIRGTANWNYSGLNVIRNSSNTSTPRFISMPLDGDDLSSTTIGGYNAIWGVYDSAPTTGSTSSALNGAMVYGAYAGHRWNTNGTERMRINSSGNLLVGTTSDIQSGTKLQVNGGIACIAYSTKAGNAGAFGGNGFNINWTGSAFLWIDATNVGQFSFVSDYRIKKNIQNQTTPALERIEKLRPVTYERTAFKNLYKDDGVVREGFIAHELAEVIPSAVEGEKDAVDQIQSLSLDALCSVMVKAIQELNDKVEAQAAEIAVLKGAK